MLHVALVASLFLQVGSTRVGRLLQDSKSICASMQFCGVYLGGGRTACRFTRVIVMAETRAVVADASKTIFGAISLLVRIVLVPEP